MKDSVTIITVCRNACTDLAETVQAVAALTYRPLEYIIIDGASSDGSLSVIKKAEQLCAGAGIAFRYVSEPDGGIYDAMNKGTGLAHGVWLNFMNAGDVPGWFTGYLRRCNYERLKRQRDASAQSARARATVGAIS